MRGHSILIPILNFVTILELLMPPDHWERVQSVFFSVADMPLEERPALLDAACADDCELRAEVELLLASDGRGTHPIADAIANEAALLDAATPHAAATTSMEGSMIGPWRVIRELGHGGMGTVYLAARADEEYEAQAAIKVVRRGLDTDFILHRFRRERQILAGLEHPNIARMFDGGTGEGGNPYFVMEYVDGLSITRYATEHKLTVEERVRLCLPVCSAVAYAHRHFIVHRDLKPGNILIDGGGVPKLLDFGVSKLLQSDHTEAREQDMLTPDYASPEQILGDPITLASDVYSLGVVIYELLAQARPYRIERCSPEAWERAICQDPVQLPSVAATGDGSLARCLKGDLDSIILHAIQREPGRRYPTMELLADDLQRFLEHRPISAGPDSNSYRFGKFIRRNRVSTALGATAALALLAATIVAMQQANVAHERFQDVRKLATAFVFDVEDAVRPLPGSTRVRELIARTGVDYLNRLSRSSARDWDLKRELASAWLRIGIVQGGLDSSNLGDPSAALISFGNARRLLEEVQRHDPSDARAALGCMIVLYQTSDVQRSMGRSDAAIASAQEGLRVASSPPAGDSKNPDVLLYTGLLHLDMARLRRDGDDLAGAESEAAAGARLLRQTVAARPENREAQLGLSNLDASLGTIKHALGRPKEALASYRSGVAVLEALCRRYPSDTLARRELMFAYGHVGDTLGNPGFNDLGDSAGAFQAYGKMAEQAKFLYDADPADAHALGDYGIALLRLGIVTPRDGPLRKQTLESSRALLKRATEKNPKNRMLATHSIWVETELGNYPAAIALAEKMLSTAPDELSAVRLMESAVRPLAEEQARKGQRQEALATVGHPLHWAARTNAAVPQRRDSFACIARAWQTAGSVYEIFAEGETGESAAADRATARLWYQRALDEWRKIEVKSLVPRSVAEMKAAERALAPGGLDRKEQAHR